MVPRHSFPFKLSTYKLSTFEIQTFYDRDKTVEKEHSCFPEIRWNVNVGKCSKKKKKTDAITDRWIVNSIIIRHLVKLSFVIKIVLIQL